MRRLLPLFVLIGLCLGQTYAQSSVFFRNNSNFNFAVNVVETGVDTVLPHAWTQHQQRHEAWVPDRELFSVDRDSIGLSFGDTSMFEIRLGGDSNFIALQMRIVATPGATELAYSVAGPGFDDAWYTDGSFHAIDVTYQGWDLTIKYRPENDDTNQDRDVLWVVHQKKVYDVSAVDAANPMVLNVISYNVQMLPLFIGGFDNNLRSRHIPLHLDTLTDVLILQEAFDPLSNDPDLFPGLEALGYVHNSGLVNDYFPWNGGVIIFSRWPIETTDEIDFALCGPNSGDCFANKGVKYARINKLGQRYHVFGTHLDAGSAQADLVAKNLQFREMRDFMGSLGIPANEPVIYGGDFNVSPVHGHNLYANMLDSLDPVLPHYSGFYETNMNLDTGVVIDNIWTDSRFLMPIQSTNEIFTLRSIADDMWDISDLSDHRTVLGRFAFPTFWTSGGDTTLCMGDNLTMGIGSSVGGYYQWRRDTTPIFNATGTGISIVSFNPFMAGNYTCDVQYSLHRGGLPDAVNQLFFPNGPHYVWNTQNLQVADVQMNSACFVSAEDALSQMLTAYPNPTDAELNLRFSQYVGPATLALFDATGRLVWNGEMKGAEASVDVGGLQSGVYAMRVQVKDAAVVKRLVIH